MTNLVINTQNSTPYNNSINTAIKTTVSMTSLEIVDFINNHRKANGNNTELRHDHFIAKVPQVLGEMNAPKFSGTQSYGNNNIRSIYNFPKREACLMAMSYSYDIQAEIYDRMTILEQQMLMLSRPSYMIEDPIERANKWIEECNQKQEAETKLLEAKQVIEVQTPKAEVFDAVLDKTRTYSIREFAQRTGVKEKDVKKWIVEKRWATGHDSKTFRPASWSNQHNYMRMMRVGKPFTNAWGYVIYNEVIAFTQQGHDEAVRKMVKSGMMKPLAIEVVEANNYQLQA